MESLSSSDIRARRAVGLHELYKSVMIRMSPGGGGIKPGPTYREGIRNATQVQSPFTGYYLAVMHRDGSIDQITPQRPQPARIRSSSALALLKAVHKG
jgi:hypothetical protein